MGTTQSNPIVDPIATIRGAISRRAIVAGGIVGALVNLNALFIPPFAVIGGGLIGGFVGGYAVGGPVRGPVHGSLAGTVVGVASATLVTTLGVFVGLYTQPPSLLGKLTGILVPRMVHRAGAVEPLLVFLGIVAIIVLDGTVGGVAGGLVRSTVDRIAGRD